VKRKTPTFNTRKTCEKCGRAAWYRPRERQCNLTEIRMGARFWCYGPLKATPIERAPRPKPSRLELADQAHARAVKAHAAAVRREEAATRARRAAWKRVVQTNAAYVRAKIDAERSAEAQRTAERTRAYFTD
jgi:hypothetical protein